MTPPIEIITSGIDPEILQRVLKYTYYREYHFRSFALSTYFSRFVHLREIKKKSRIDYIVTTDYLRSLYSCLLPRGEANVSTKNQNS